MGRDEMIILDTHIWVWWVHDEQRLSKPQLDALTENENDVIGINAISCWEVAKLVEYKRLELPCPIDQWFDQALNYPGVQLLELSVLVAIESTKLPGEFHRDSADQMIVASARLAGSPLLTNDRRILNYSHVVTIG